MNFAPYPDLRHIHARVDLAAFVVTAVPLQRVATRVELPVSESLDEPSIQGINGNGHFLIFRQLESDGGIGAGRRRVHIQ